MTGGASEQWVAAKPEDLPTLQEIRGIAGLEYLEGMLAGRFAHPPISGVLNYRLASVQRGEVTFHGTPTFDCMNPLGTVHGGWYATLLDSAMACAVMSCLEVGQFYTTLEFKVNITRPVPPGGTVAATGRVQHPGRRTSVANGEIKGAGDGTLYATASTTCIIL